MILIYKKATNYSDWGEGMKEKAGILCPVCNNKTRLMVRADTILENFPLYCPKCKQETLINIQKLNMAVVKEPDAGTQSQ